MITYFFVAETRSIVAVMGVSLISANSYDYMH